MTVAISTPYLVLPVGRRDHVRGPATAPATLLEYGDFECPHCGTARPIIEEVRRVMGDDLRFAYRHFPLTLIHPRAEPAAEAAEAAGAQRRFWQMHDLLYEHQSALEDEDLLLYATTLRLDIQLFTGDLGTGVHRPRVREDFMSGVQSGVSGTPTFFINDMRYSGPRDVHSLVLAIRKVIA
jgi:protein-disulfide isomerase